MSLFYVATLIAVFAMAALLATSVAAFPVYPALIPNGDNVVRNGQPWPGVGHDTAQGGSALNQFGADFAAAGHSWTTALCNKDSDNDGYTNGIELGDPNCAWSVGQTPARTTGISHPGYSDSVPSVTTVVPGSQPLTTTMAPLTQATAPLGATATPVFSAAPTTSLAAWLAALMFAVVLAPW